MSLALALAVSACGGGSDRPDDAAGDPGGQPVATDEPGDEQPSGDGTRLLVAGRGGIDVVDLVAESQEPFISDLGQVGNLRLIAGVLWFVEGTDLVAADAVSGELKGRASVPNGVVDLAVAGDTAWVLTGIPGVSTEIVVIDAETMTLLGSIQAPESTTYQYLAVAGDDAWAFGGDVESATAASKLDAATLSQSASVDTGLLADSMTAGLGGIWIGGTVPAFSSDGGTPESGIVKLDRGTGDVTTTIGLGAPADHIVVAVGFDHLWATKGLDGTLYKIDPATGEVVDSIDTGGGAAGIPLEIIFTADLVWVFNTTDDTATAYDPDTLEFAQGINVPAFAPAPIFAP